MHDPIMVLRLAQHRHVDLVRAAESHRRARQARLDDPGDDRVADRVAEPVPEPVVVREVRAGEHAVLDAVFEGMSARSRYLRFHSAMPRLSPSVRRRLAEVDGLRHTAFVALAAGRPIGLSRYVSLGDGRAEIAVDVVDAWHGAGVGTLLVRALTQHARERGFTALVAEVLAENEPMLKLLRREFPGHQAVREGVELTLTLPLCAAGCVADRADEPVDLLPV